MGLRDHRFNLEYNKYQDDISTEFYLPCMRESIRYDRLTGFFSSYILSIAWDALRIFIYSGGTIRVICSSILSEEDFYAINGGLTSIGKETIEHMLIEEMDKILDNPILSKPARLLSCLVGLKKASFKIATLYNSKQSSIKRMFHDKVGIFIDGEGDATVFRGSMNETVNGLSPDGNVESISVYCSWTDNNDAERVRNAVNHFENLWTDKVDDVSVIDFSSIVEESSKRKYPIDEYDKLLDSILTDIANDKKWTIKRRDSFIVPRPHQLEALQNWEKNGRCGILEHATGSGKTITAICAINEAHRRGETALVLVPSHELVLQWKREIERALSPRVKILICDGRHKRWFEYGVLESWSSKSVDCPKVIISTIDTACNDAFRTRLRAGEQIFLVADEVHRLGSYKARELLELNVGPRLGLSATPKRFGDPEGTESLFSFFRGVITPPFTIKDAINLGVLTKYIYIPHILYLEPDEQDQWNVLTKNIGRILSQCKDSKTATFENERLKSLVLRRSRIIKNAIGKVALALKVLEENYSPGQRWIVYCDNKKQMNSVLDIITQKGFDACEYHASMQGDRCETLRHFCLYGGILVSIKCLDEGVDIPSVTHAMILASSQNPREFIQRRGRILRKHEGKHYAFLHDAIVLPCQFEADASYSFVTHELARSRNFAETADNKSCVHKIELIAIRHGIDLYDYNEGGFEDESTTSR